MKFVEIKPFRAPKSAVVEIPGSKSYTNRALLLGALTKGPVTLENPLFCEDTAAMMQCLKTLGLRIETEPSKIVVYDDITVVKKGDYQLHAADSGTTFRFLLALLCLTPGTKWLTGSPRLNVRPIQGLVEALKLLGAKIDYLTREDQPPLKIHPSSLQEGCCIPIDTSISSQFFSALLMIAPFINGPTLIPSSPPISKPYIDMTIGMMKDWGVTVIEKEDGSYHVPARQQYKKSHYVIEGDFSSAGYFFAMGALTQSTITLKNLSPLSLQADRKFVDILAQMGNDIHYEEGAITIRGKQILPISLDMEECPDQVQTMAVLSAFAKGVTKIGGVRSLRVKETERVKALRCELAKMGIKTEETENTLTIHGGNPKPAIIESYNDHRMAMSFAVAGTKLPGMKILNPYVVNKTFPFFWDTLRSL